MLKAASRVRKNGKPAHLVVVGLSHTNLDRLRAGQMIEMDATELGLPAIEIIIFAGKTEQSMLRDVGELIGPLTKTTIDPRLRD